MMKQVKFKLPLRSLAIAGGLFLSATAFAQSGSVRGQVKESLLSVPRLWQTVNPWA